MSVAATSSFNLMWTEKPGHSEDVDLMAFAYDAHGRFLGRVGFDNASGTLGGVTINHSGDSKDGIGRVIDETLHVQFSAMASPVHYIAIVVLVNNQKHLITEMFSEFRLMIAPFVQEYDFLTMWAPKTKTFVPIVLVRASPINFSLTNPACFCAPEKTFINPEAQALSFQTGMCFVWPLLESILDTYIDPKMRMRTNPLSLNLADKIFLPVAAHQSNSNKKSFVGLGWDVSKHKSRIDLDAHCIVVREGSHDYEHIYFGNKLGCHGAVHHLGDNLTGEGSGDDERIMIDLNKISQVDPTVKKLLFVVQIFTSDVTFAKVNGEYVRVVLDDEVVARFDLDNIAGPMKKVVEKANAALFCVLERVPVGRYFQWQFHAVLQPVDKQALVKDCVKVAKKL